jgi:hypothetical protein
MRTRQFAKLATTVVSLCIGGALVLPAAASASAAQSHGAAGGRAQTYLIFLKSPASTVSTGAERARVVSSQASVESRLASLGVTPLNHYLVPDVITAKLRPAQVASMRLLPGVASVLRNGLIPEANADVSPVHFHAGTVHDAHALSAHLAAGVCGSVGHPQLDPQALTNINAEPAVKAGFDGAGVKVAFIADGVDTTNPDFQRNAKFASPGNLTGHPVITRYVDFGGDGTSAPTSGGEAFLDASSIVAQGNSVYDLSNYVSAAHPLPTGCDMRVEGDAPGVDLTAIKVFSNSFTTNADFVAAINYAVTHGIKVLNESFGSNPLGDDSLDATKLADNAAVKAGVTVVVSSGDAGITNTIGSPSDDPLVISAGASTTFRAYQQYTFGGINAPGIGNGKVFSNNISSISSSGFAYDGKTVDVVAPGDYNWALCSTSANYADCGGSNLEFTGGTSEAAPLTSGAAADVIQAYADTHHGADPTPALVKRIITSTAQDISAPAEQQGAGLLDVSAAVALARSIKGTTAAHPAGGLLASASQLDLSGAPSAHTSGTIKLTNTSSSTTIVHAYVRALSRTGQTTGSVTMDPSTESTQPTFSIWSGFEEVYQTANFTVPSGTDRVAFQAAFQDEDQSSLLHVALFSPNGTYAGYSLPQGLGDYVNIGVANPGAGKWTAVFFTVSDNDGPSDIGTSGPVPWAATYWKFKTVGTVSHPSLTIGAGQTKQLKVTIKDPSSAGDTAYSLVIAGPMTVPITLRTTVDVHSGGHFSGVLTGGNGRSGAEAQSDVFAFKVPAGKNDLDASIALSSNVGDPELPGAQMVGELIDPSGLIQAFDTNYTLGSGGFEVTPYLNLYKSQPVPGNWYLQLYWVNPVMGIDLAIPYTGAIQFNLVSESNNLPDSPSTDVSASHGGTFSVNVNNNGVAPLLLTPDARLTTNATYTIGDCCDSNPATQTIPGVAYNSYYIPNGTSSVSVNQTSTVKASFDFSTFPGDPDLSPLNGHEPDVSTTQTSSSASLTFSPPSGVTPGVWFNADSVVGPFGPGAAASGTETTSVNITTLAFDPAVSSADGDYVEALTVGGPAADVEVDPGTSVAIPIDINPTAAVSTTVSGTLLVVGISAPGFFAPTISPEDLFTNELAAIPYEYTVSS